MPVEIALMEIDGGLNEMRRWYSLVDPEIPIDPAAQAIHGISAEMVADSPTSNEFIDHVLGGRLEGDLCLIAHNRRFDQPLLEHIGSITHGICTLELARHLVRDSANHKLQTLREHFDIEANKAHSAMGDVETTLGVLRHLVRLSGKTLAELSKATAKTYHVMPFGKFSGQSILTLPKWYLDYMVALPDLDPNLLASLTKARKLK